jgi:hypothetical protein
MMADNIQNPGSALGEAIGAEMEKALNLYLADLVGGMGYHFISIGLNTKPGGKPKKLLLHDSFGTAYNIDAVVANAEMQPIILIESKYIRYKKHNRDKGSWICTAHPALRRRYASLRSSIAVLAGNWSQSSIAMMKSYDINIFRIPFEVICGLLAERQIQFNWDEKDRLTAQSSWQRYNRLKSEEKATIGAAMIEMIKPELGSLVLKILDDSLPREIDRVAIELHSTLGEVKTYEFQTIADAIGFLNQAELNQIFLASDAHTLFDPIPTTA